MTTSKLGRKAYLMAMSDQALAQQAALITERLIDPRSDMAVLALEMADIIIEAEARHSGNYQEAN